MGIGAMSAVMLRLPLTSVLPATLLQSDGLAVTPLVVVAVVLAYVVSARITPATARGPSTQATPAPPPETGTPQAAGPAPGPETDRLS